ncbi:virion structural protein [Vibrio phage D479]
MKGSHVALILATVIAVPTFVGVSSYVGAHNKGTEWEADIGKFHKESQNTLANYTTKIMEMAQVPGKYKEDLKEVISATFGGRYGKDGSKATMQWIQEQNLPFDSSMYTRLQNTMEAGRNEFRLSQTKKIDICGNYEKELGYFWGGMWLRMAGFPKKDLSDVCKVVLNDHTNKAFETGIDNGIKL